MKFPQSLYIESNVPYLWDHKIAAIGRIKYSNAYLTTVKQRETRDVNED